VNVTASMARRIANRASGIRPPVQRQSYRLASAHLFGDSKSLCVIWMR